MRDRSLGKAERYSGAMKLGLIPCSSIRGQVQVVPADVSTTLIVSTVSQNNLSRCLKKICGHLNCSILTDYVMHLKAYFGMRFLKNYIEVDSRK